MTVLVFIGILIVLIVVHELGHFLAAKLFGVRVDEFGVGFPPKLWGKKWGETEYTINLLPIGGFVRIFGEDEHTIPANSPDTGRSLAHKNHLIQAIVLLAGVTFNILFAFVVFTLGFMFGMPSAITEEEMSDARDVKLLITEVIPGSPAETAGLVPGDEIVGLVAEGGSYRAELTPSSVALFISEHPGEELTIAIARGGGESQATVVPKTGVITDAPERPAAGFVMTLAGIITLSPTEALQEGFAMTYSMLKAITIGLWDFIARAVRLDADFSYVSGPVGIVGSVGDAKALGTEYLVSLAAFISLNLAVINLLPFPALDGGRLLFVLIETITRRRIPSVITRILNLVGFCILIGLMVIVTFSDIGKLL